MNSDGGRNSDGGTRCSRVEGLEARASVAYLSSSSSHPSKGVSSGGGGGGSRI